jgi:hypothetical protein
MKGSANVSLSVDRIARIKISFPDEKARESISNKLFEAKESISSLKESLRMAEENYQVLVEKIKASL